MKPLCSGLLFLWAVLVTSSSAAETGVVRGADELFWVPTLEQALEMARPPAGRCFSWVTRWCLTEAPTRSSARTIAPAFSDPASNSRRAVCCPNQEVHTRLAEKFIGVRFDWEQGNHYKTKFGFIPGTGDQLLLTPGGELIRSEKPDKSGKPTVIYGRHGCDTTGAVLDNV